MADNSTTIATQQVQARFFPDPLFPLLLPVKIFPLLLPVKILGHEQPINATTDHQLRDNYEIRSARMIDYSYLQSLSPEGTSLLDKSIVTPTPPCTRVMGTMNPDKDRLSTS